jgi:hypothetical protein
LVLFIYPLEWNIFLDQVVKRSSNCAKIFDKSAIEPSEAMETPYLVEIFRCRPLFYCFALLFINKDSLHTHNKTNENNMFFKRKTLQYSHIISQFTKQQALSEYDQYVHQKIYCKSIYHQNKELLSKE